MNWMIAGIGGVFLLINAFFLFGKDYNLAGHIITNLVMVGAIGIGLFLLRRFTQPKGLGESIAAARLFYKKSMYGDSNMEPPLEVMEAARYKEDILKTMKNVVHTIVFKNKEEDKDVVIKDDPFVRANPSSVVFFNPDSPFLSAPYKTKVEMEKEIK